MAKVEALFFSLFLGFITIGQDWYFFYNGKDNIGISICQ